MPLDLRTLRLRKPMMYGSAVKRLQELGDSIGIDGGDNDGIFGPRTEQVVRRVQKRLCVTQDGIYGPVTSAALIAHIDKLSKTSLGREFVDIRGTHPPPRNFGRKRKWSEIDSVLLHQTGCNMPVNPRNWKKLNAHFGVSQEGKLIWVNDATDMIWHAQGLSKRSIGIEIEGNFRGVESKPKTLWRGGGPACNLNLPMHLALNELFELLKGEFKKNGQEWKHVFCHRQSSNMRRGDPGSEIYQGVALDWMKKLGGTEMDGGSEFSKGSGLPIPAQWNPAYTDNKY